MEAAREALRACGMPSVRQWNAKGLKTTHCYYYNALACTGVAKPGGLACPLHMHKGGGANHGTLLPDAKYTELFGAVPRRVSVGKAV